MRIYLENKDLTDLIPLEFGVEQKARNKAEPERMCDYHTIHYIISGKQGYSVYQTSQLVGYSDQFIFSKAFKKYFGYSPSKLKKLNTIIDG